MVEKGEEEGLSPRVRGNLPCFASYVTVIGSIPACAGEPANEIFGRGNWGVYPRVCGGTSPARFGRVYPRVCGGTTSLIAWGSAGLSPRVRGNLAPTKREILAVYPRVCGGTL